jgi:hypothetical protein
MNALSQQSKAAHNPSKRKKLFKPLKQAKETDLA